MPFITFPFASWIVGYTLLLPTVAGAINHTTPFAVDAWTPPFNQQRQHVRTEYVPLARAARPWRLCASIPHLKDDYWLSANCFADSSSRSAARSACGSSRQPTPNAVEARCPTPLRRLRDHEGADRAAG